MIPSYIEDLAHFFNQLGLNLQVVSIAYFFGCCLYILLFCRKLKELSISNILLIFNLRISHEKYGLICPLGNNTLKSSQIRTHSFFNMLYGELLKIAADSTPNIINVLALTF